MSTILVDNLTGKTSAGDITVTSEGGAATQFAAGVGEGLGCFCMALQAYWIKTQQLHSA
jgi:hypothetical protein